LQPGAWRSLVEDPHRREVGWKPGPSTSRSGFSAGGFRRMNLGAGSTLQELPLFDSREAIHSQEADCDPALGSQAEDFAIAQLMVAIPAIKARVKQRRELSGLAIYLSDVTALEPVADSATEGEILHNRPTAMLYSDHVIDLVFD
jgi:hypothetical protein